MQRIADRGVRTEWISPNDPSFDWKMAELKPDFVVFDRFITEEQFGWRVKKICPYAVRVLDTQDLHFLRRAREKILLRDEMDLGPAPGLASEDAFRELASIYRSDLTLVLSDFEAAILKDKFGVPDSLIQLLRFSYPVSELAETEAKWPKFQDRKDFVFLGNFRHPPNVDAVHWFSGEIWPKIRTALPGVEVHVYGAYPSREIMRLDDEKSGFRVFGWANDPYELLSKFRVSVAPLRFGAGIKGKITDSWWSGTPVVTTPIGSEGMHGPLPWGGEVAENAEEFPGKAIDLYRNEERWNTKQDQGFSLLRALYDSDRNSKILIDALLYIESDLLERRNGNFIGSMLWHHLHRSTTYFSKWIELKNQKNRNSGKPTEIPTLRE